MHWLVFYIYNDINTHKKHIPLLSVYIANLLYIYMISIIISLYLPILY